MDKIYRKNSLIFGKIISTINTKDAEEKYAKENFSGKFSFSNLILCSYILQYLLDNYKFKTHIDIGGATGLLSSELLKLNYDSYTVDGCLYGWDNDKLLIHNDRYCVIDFTKPIVSNAVFDIATCFEVTEHIPEKHLNQFISNIQKITDTLICTVHIGGKETPNHITIKPLNFWLNLFEQFGKVKVLNLNINNEFEDSKFLEVNFYD